MIEKLPPDLGHLCDKLNEVIEAVNAMNMSQPQAIIGSTQPHTGPHFVTGLSIAENAPQPSGFRPLHIEDGQVKEAVHHSGPERPYPPVPPEWMAAMSVPDTVSTSEPVRTGLDKEIADFLAERRGFTKQCQSMRGFPSVPEAEPQEQGLRARVRRLLQLPLPELQYAYRQEAIVRTSLSVLMDDSEIEMLRHLIHVELGPPAGFTSIPSAAHREYAQPEKKVCDHVRVRFGCVADGHTQPPQWQYIECVDCEDRMAIPAAQPGKGV